MKLSISFAARISSFLLFALFALCVVPIPNTSYATDNIITTVAGGGVGDGGPAVSAYLNHPNGVLSDAFGNIFIADTGQHRIRKVDSSGNISTTAGSTIGYSGDGGPAVSAKLRSPIGVSADAFGNIYITDTDNDRIRKIDSSGTISTVAGTGTASYAGDGGPAVSARLNYPSGVSADTFGNIFIADTYNHRIRKVDSSGNIGTIAGTGTAGYSGDGGPAVSARLLSPRGVFADASGSIYVADTYNNRIRKIDSSGTISTVAGTGTAGYSGDGGPAASAQLRDPYGVFADAYGDILIADMNNNRIRKVSFNRVPVAGSVNITGTLKEGYTLIGSYSYSDAEGDPQGMSTFRWYTSTDSACTVDKTMISGAASSSYTLTAEEVGKYVCFAVIPVAASGASPGSEVIATTSEAVSSAPPIIIADVSIVSVSNVKATTALALATAIGNGITDRGFFWWNDDTYWGSNASGLIPAGSGAGDFSLTLSSLPMITQLYVSAYIKVGGQLFTSANKISITTTGPMTPTAITKPDFTVSGNEVLAKGEITNIGSSPVTIYGFVYAAHTSPTVWDQALPFTWDMTLPISQGKPFEGTIKNLSAGKYYFRAYAHNSQGTGYGEEFSFAITGGTGDCGGGVPAI